MARPIARQCMFTCMKGSMAAETGPIRGTDRRSLAFAAEVASCAMTLSIRRSRSDGSVTAETLGDAEGCQHGQGEAAPVREVAHGGDIQPRACEGQGGDQAEGTVRATVVGVAGDVSLR